MALYHGDCRELLPRLADVDPVVTDPPYGDTSLEWDQWVAGWADVLPAPQAWVSGSMRMWFAAGNREFVGWKLAQDIVWEKHTAEAVGVEATAVGCMSTRCTSIAASGAAYTSNLR